MKLWILNSALFIVSAVIYLLVVKEFFTDDFDPTHRIFFEDARYQSFFQIFINFVLIYDRLEIGYALIISLVKNIGLPYETFMDIWSLLIVMLIIFGNRNSLIDKLLVLVFIFSSSQLMAVFVFSSTSKSFITFYIIFLLLTKNNVWASFAGCLGHLQSITSLTLMDLKSIFLIKKKSTILLYTLIIALTSILFYYFEVSYTLNALLRGSTFFEKFYDIYYFIIIFGLLFVIAYIFIFLKLNNRILFFLQRIPLALPLEILFRTNRLTINLVLFIVFFQGRYRIHFLSLGILYNIVKIAHGS